MLNAVPRSVFSWDFEVFDDTGMLAVMDVAWLKEGGSFDYCGKTYKLRKAGVFSTNFSMTEDGHPVAGAEKTPLRRFFEVESHEKTYALSALHPFTRKFKVVCDGVIVGEIFPYSIFARSCKVDTSEDIPVPLQIFMLWLVILMWRRTRKSNAAAS